MHTKGRGILHLTHAMTYKIVMLRTYETDFIIEADNEEDALKQFEAIPDKYTQELEQMNVSDEHFVVNVIKVVNQ